MFKYFRRSAETRTQHRLTEDIRTGEPLEHPLRIHTPEQAMRYTAVYSAVQLVSGDIARLPLATYRMGSETPMTGHRLYRLLRWQPRMGQSSYMFWRRAITQLLLSGEFYAQIMETNGRITDLWEFDIGACRYDRQRGIYRCTRQGAGEINLMPEEVIHISNLTLADDCPLVTYLQARDSWSLGLVMERYQQAFFDRGGHTPGILSVPAAMKKAARDKVEEGVVTKRGGSQGWFKTMVLRDGATFSKTGDSLQDTQLEQLRDQAVAEVARWFNIPPHKLGLKSAISFASTVEANRSYLINTLGPWLYAMQNELAVKLLRDDELANIEIKHDLEPLIQTVDDVGPDTNRPDEAQGRRNESEHDTELEYSETGVY